MQKDATDLITHMRRGFPNFKRLKAPHPLQFYLTPLIMRTSGSSAFTECPALWVSSFHHQYPERQVLSCFKNGDTELG